MKKEKEDIYTLELPEGEDTIRRGMVNLPEGFKGRLIIPEGVQMLGDGCFMDKPITAVSLPKSLREIGIGAFVRCRLRELRVEGDGRMVKIYFSAFEQNPGLSAVTLGNCELQSWIFRKCPVSRITLTGECIPPEKDDTFGFVGCRNQLSDNFFEAVRDKYGGALGTYALKGKLAEVNYKPDGRHVGCAKCDYRCYTLVGFEDDRSKMPVFEWEKIE